MVELSLTDMVVGFVAAMGVPSAVMGLIAWWLQRKLSDREQAQDEKNRDQEELVLLLVQSTRASIALGEATAHAMQRGHTNGDMEKALEYADEVKGRQKSFLEKKGIHAILED